MADESQSPLPITGRLSVTLDDQCVAKPSRPSEYVGVAQSLLPGIRHLKGADAPVALAFLCGQTLEVLLKAYLSKTDPMMNLRSRSLRHNLEMLWKKAFDSGLPVSATPPAWAIMLIRVHDTPYILRYAPGVHGFQTPASEPMVTDLEEILSKVEQYVNQ